MKVHASISMADAQNATWDAVVIGAGPTGSVAARQLAVAGFRTLLVDRKSFPRPKVCGACVNLRALQTLRNLGMPQVDALPSVPLNTLAVRCRDRAVEIEAAGGIAVSRMTFDVALINAAIESGAAFLPQTNASVLPCTTNSPTRTVEIHSESTSTTLAARVVVAADGLNNSSLKQLDGFDSSVAAKARVGVGGSLQACPDFVTPGTIFMAVGRNGYVGMVRLEDASLNMAAAIAPELIKSQGSVGSAVNLIVEQAGFPRLSSSHLANTTWLGTIPVTRRRSHIANHRLLVVGDAAGYIEPFTGEGMAWGITGGAASAAIAARHMEDWSPRAEQEWASAYRTIVRNRQFWCRTISRALRYPWLVSRVLGTMQHFPGIPSRIVRSVNSVPKPIPSLRSADS